MPVSSNMQDKKLYLGGFHPFLEDRLVHEVTGARSEDPLVTVIILIGSNILGAYTRRLLARRLGTAFQIRFLTFLDLAKLLASGSLIHKGQAEVSPLGSKLIVEEFLQKTLSEKRKKLEYFSEIASYDGFRDAVIGTFEDLKEAGITYADFNDIVRRLQKDRRGIHGKWEDLSTIYDSCAQFLQERRLYDRSDLFLEAYHVAKQSKASLQECFNGGQEHLLSFFIYGFYDFTFIQRKILEECVRGVDCCAFFPFRRKKQPAYRYAEKTRAWFESLGFKAVEEEAGEETTTLLRILQERSSHEPSQKQQPSGSITHDGSFEIISAPGEVREVREIVRKVLELIKEGFSFEDIAIILKNREDYLPLIRELFDYSNIPFYSATSQSLLETREAQSLLLFLSLRDADYSRRDVMHFVTFADLNFQKVFEDSWEPSVSEWDFISMRAGIVSGRDDWIYRLKNYIDGLKSDDTINENGEVRTESIEKIKNAERFLLFAEKLLAAIASIPAQGKWNVLSDAVISAFEKFVTETDTLGIIEDALAELHDLEVIQESTSLSQYTRFLQDKLGSSFLERGRFQSGSVAVLDLASARGMGFKVVIAPGLVERRFPAIIRQDPLLLDSERKHINDLLSDDRLSLKMERAEEEKLLFELLTSSALGRLVLTYPRIDPDTASERVPSFFLLQAAESMTGESIDFENIEGLPFFIRSPLSQLFPSDEKLLMDELECNLKLMAEAMDEKRGKEVYFLAQLFPLFRNALIGEHSRWGARNFTPYDGVLKSEDALKYLRERHSIIGNTVSASSLEMYASCPFRYLCDKILSLEVIEEPEDIETISPLDKGSLYHDILFDLFEILKADGRLPLKERDIPSCLSLLETVSREHFLEMQSKGRTGFEMMWMIEQERIIDDLKQLMKMEVESGSGYIPAYFETRFGMRKRGSFEGPLSTDLPVEFSIDDRRKVFFKGRIDRVDISRDDRRGRVIDYKSGAVYHSNNAFMGGKALQLPIYILAAEEIMRRAAAGEKESIKENITVDEAQYFYVTRKGRFSRRHFNRTGWDEKTASLKYITRTIAEGIEHGLFFQARDIETCRNCDYALLCGTAKDIRFDRKKADTRIADFLRMMDID